MVRARSSLTPCCAIISSPGSFSHVFFQIFLLALIRLRSRSNSIQHETAQTVLSLQSSEKHSGVSNYRTLPQQEKTQELESLPFSQNKCLLFWKNRFCDPVLHTRLLCNRRITQEMQKLLTPESNLQSVSLFCSQFCVGSRRCSQTRMFQIFLIWNSSCIIQRKWSGDNFELSGKHCKRSENERIESQNQFTAHPTRTLPFPFYLFPRYSAQTFIRQDTYFCAFTHSFLHLWCKSIKQWDKIDEQRTENEESGPNEAISIMELVRLLIALTMATHAVKIPLLAGEITLHIPTDCFSVQLTHN